MFAEIFETFIGVSLRFWSFGLMNHIRDFLKETQHVRLYNILIL